MNDPHDLNRFVAAQENVYETALKEIRNGRKQTHWMWFIFPQIVGLGQTEISKTYAIKSREEALAYLNHPTLGERLREASQALLSVEDKSATDIFGTPDDLKLRSSMTLFKSVSTDNDVFLQVLDNYYGGEEDPQTVRILSKM
ncbi:DUF1810 domain-containing protein [Salmonirosea aquatica]|uniref:DUF1810 family protein n=1 Tax=Salmonirosea aquatica TaxID=2654236 RepID=A0A7C9BGJ3_9BACT|nr:DUF1810 family protein [Cytophagaceae bacterium SJW1-29]